MGFDGTNVGGVAAADYVAKCSTAGTWTALGAGFNTLPYGCDVDKTTGFIWWAGNFTVADGQAVLYIATYELGATTGSGGVFEGGGGTDGTCYDVKITDCNVGVYLDGNAVHKICPETGKVTTIAKNANNSGGIGGLLDRPSEVCIRGNRLYISNIDLPGDGNVYVEPHTISVIELDE